MNKKFTKLIAALALLVFMTPSLVGWGQDTWNHSFSSGQIKTTAGDITLSGKTWTQTAATYIGWDGSTGKGIQIGSGSNPTLSFSLLTADFSTYTISSISVNSSIASSGTAKLNIKVGNTTYLENQALTTTATDYSCQPNVSGNIEISWTNTAKAFYVKSITVVYTTGSGTTTYTVTYDGNGADQGTVPTDNNEYEEGDEVTVLGPGTMAKTGHTFEWWEDAEGIPYEEDDTFEIYENTTLTAQWSVNTYDYTLNVTGDDEEAEAELEVDGSTVATGAKIAYNKEVTVVVVTNDGYRYSIAVEDADHNTISVTNDKFTMPDSDVTVTVTTSVIPTYTITFNAGTGTCDTPSMSGQQGSPITLPSANPSSYCAEMGWTFAGWAEASVVETQTAPTLLNGSYTINGDATLYAVYQGTEGEGNTDVEMDFSQGTYSNETITWTIDNVVSILQEKHTGQTAPNNDYVSAPRWYTGNKITITPSVSINTITVTTTTDGYATTLANSTYTNATASASGSGSVVTITPSNSGVITIVMGGQSRISSLSVNYGSSTTTYNSNPLCQMATLTVNLDNIDANIAEGDWSHEIVLNNGSAQVAAGAQVLVSLFVMDDCRIVGESPLTVVDGNEQSVTVEFDEEDDSYVFTMPESGATLTATSEALPQSTLTVDASSNVTLEITYGGLSTIVELDENTAELCQGVEVTIQVTIAEGYVLQSLNVVGSNGQAVSVEEEGENTYSFAMPATGATLTVTTDIDIPVNAEFALYTGELVEGDYVIYYDGYAMKNTVSNSRLTNLVVTPSSEDIISNPDASIVWHIAQSGDYWTIYNAAVKKYAAGTGADNKAQLLGSGTDDKSQWTLTTNTTTYDFENKYNKAQNKNAVLRNNGTNGWACYNPNNVGGALSLYKKVEYTAETEIVAYTPTSGWYFVASPFVGEISHNVNVGDEGTDLYYYDEQNHMWRNSKNAANANNFDFANGKGYLYANSESVTLEFVGSSVVTSNTRSISLSYHATTSGGQENSLAGWNLVGNPFNGNATLDQPCYTIDGLAINTEAHTAGNYTVAPCEGVMVKATEAGQTVTFTKASQQTSQPNQLQLTVAQQVVTRCGVNSLVNDNAIINFNEGSLLEKFTFNADAAKLYIPQNGKEYAIVNAEGQGELPINFLANVDGQYTLTVNPEGIEMGYLHLIDNMTGMDIDLLQTPSYTFEATTRDYESRFRLVFAANEDGVSTGSTAFAFFSNGNWIINNDGEAILQVIDVTGRIISSESVNGSVSTTLNATPGVYMLRLINGENVKVQKIVVR